MNKKQFEKLEKKTIKNIDLIPEDTDYCYTIDREKLKEQGGKTFELGIPIKNALTLYGEKVIIEDVYT